MIARGLVEAGHDAVHVRDYGLQDSEDNVIFDRDEKENRILISTDSDFGTIQALRKKSKPSVILFRRLSDRRPVQQLTHLRSNLQTIAKELEKGSIVVIEQARIRIRRLPIY